VQTDDLEVRDLDGHECLVLFWSWRLEVSVWILGRIGKSIMVEVWLFHFFMAVNMDIFEFDAFRISWRRRVDW
jgi:hypothetical protein